MQKTILITGATDGIGLETAKALTQQGHHVLIHGRNPAKVSKVLAALSRLSKSAIIESYIADLSTLSDVDKLATQIKNNHKRLDILINNAGVYKVSDITTSDNLDVRFVVNTIAP
ncbi:SDR family NAD(P)-dependent oxidoreductase, partial [Vibrio crassostreae]